MTVAVDVRKGTMVSDACVAHAVRIGRAGGREEWQIGPGLIFGGHAGNDRLDRGAAIAAMRLGELLATGLDSLEPWSKQAAELRRLLGWGGESR